MWKIKLVNVRKRTRDLPTPLEPAFGCYRPDPHAPIAPRTPRRDPHAPIALRAAAAGNCVTGVVSSP
jgi:hypothetical protein